MYADFLQIILRQTLIIGQLVKKYINSHKLLLFS
jgi:hypothetical protein